MPQAWIDWIATMVQSDRIFPWVLDEYWKLTVDWTETDEITSSEDFRAEFLSMHERESIQR